MAVPALAKRLAGAGLGLAPHARYDRTVLLLGHMRCGSTALANVLAAHPAISGCGESHVSHGAPAGPGRLVLSQIRAGRWKPTAPLLFDKVLHDHLDADAPPAFFTARALFLTRAPEEAIASILALFSTLNTGEYPNSTIAAGYYTRRLARLAALWDRFPPTHRLALRHEQLLAAPDAALAAISRFLALDPPLANAYRASPARPGAGDPLAAPRHGTITATASQRRPPAALARTELADARAAHAAFLARTDP